MLGITKGRVKRLIGNVALDKSRDIRMGSITMDFGVSPFGDICLGTVAASFVTSATRINCQPLLTTTDDHDPEDVLLEEIIVRPMNITPGVGFDLMAYAPNGTFGKYLIQWMGR